MGSKANTGVTGTRNPSTQDSVIGGGSSAPEHDDAVSQPRVRNSGDVGWKYGYLPKPNKLGRVRCKLCDHEADGGVYRLKQHIAGIRGNVSACPKATNEDKQICLAALNNVVSKKRVKQQKQDDLRNSVEFPTHNEEDGDVVEVNPSKRTKNFGPMDRFTIDPEEAIRIREKQVKVQPTIKDALAKEMRDKVNQYVDRWIYQAGIPFYAVTHDSFTTMLEAIGAYGRGYKGPSMYELSNGLLRKEVEITKEDLRTHKEEWKRSGCSIMTDAWTDRRHRSIMNMCVNCKLGTSFHSSLECSSEAHTGEFIFEWVDKCIDEVGEEHILQVVTDNASANKKAAELLQEKRPRIFWSYCAAHTLDLALEGIAKLERIKSAIDKAKALTVFIYSHHKTLAMMRRHTKKRDIVRPGITRFATLFLTLQSMVDKKEKLRFMFTSDEWVKCKWSKSIKGKVAAANVLSNGFWNAVSLALRVYSPLVNVLRVADSDWRPSMAYIYGYLMEAIKEIKEVTFKGHEDHAKPIIDIVKEKVKGRLDSPLHVAGYCLNPYYFYKYRDLIEQDALVMPGLCQVVETFYPNIKDQDKVVKVEFLQYTNASDLFGRSMAIRQRNTLDSTFDAAHWWKLYGSETPLLQAMAIKVLNLTASSSGCERNWSVFEGIHTKKRNRLETTKLNNLVFVQFNAKLKQKRRTRRDDGKEKDPLVAKDACNAVDWLVENVEQDDNEEFPEGFSWRIVGDASRANELTSLRRSERIASRVSGGDVDCTSIPTSADDEDIVGEEEEDDSEEGEVEDMESDDDGWLGHFEGRVDINED